MNVTHAVCSSPLRERIIRRSTTATSPSSVRAILFDSLSDEGIDMNDDVALDEVKELLVVAYRAAGISGRTVINDVRVA